MSELLGNKDGKKELIKGFIMRLHKGEDSEKIKEEFKDVIKGLTPLDIARIEGMLIKEGMPREEIHMLCDVHLAAFRDAIENARPDVPAWHPIYILMEEHKSLVRFAEMLRGAVKQIQTSSTVEEDTLHHINHIMEHFKEAAVHYEREENVLFPYIEKHGVTEPPAIMWMDHDVIRSMGKALKENLSHLKAGNAPEDMTEIMDSVIGFAETLSSHFYKENNILYPTALRIIGAEEWADIRTQFDEIGYCCFTPARGEMPSEVAKDGEKIPGEGVPAFEKAETGMEETGVEMKGTATGTKGAGKEDAEKGIIRLPSGNLTLKELTAVLNALPLDISFVDSEDTVRYFNETAERIFPRARAIVGRKVQNCHPQKSVHMVNRIIEDFRSGKNDVAEFWIDMKGRKIHIRYFAVRGPEGEYLGALELTQDITEIQGITGEKRLMD